MYRICIAGRPNVGKSTLFNRLIGRRWAITDATPGVTRDPVEYPGILAGHDVMWIDTGGIGEGDAELDHFVYERSRRAIAAADLVVLLVDVMGLTGEDEELVDLVRRTGRPSILCINKVDNPMREQLVDEFWSLGFARVVAISAAHGLGIDGLGEEMCGALGIEPQANSVERAPERGRRPRPGRASRSGAPSDDDQQARTVESDTAESGDEEEPGDDQRGDSHAEAPRAIRLAIVGRPNTGKSSLLNRLVGEDRAIVSNLAGTTRDVVEANFEAGGRQFVVVDTAGIRRRSRVEEAIEYYAVTRAEEAIARCDVAVLVIDSTDGLGEQDKKIAARIADLGRGVIVALNKWDLLDDRGNQLQAMTDRIHFLFPVFSHVPVMPISAVTGEGVDAVVRRAVAIDVQLHQRIETGPLNQLLRRWVAETPPPQGKRPIKVRYITQVSTHPVRFIAFVNRRKSFPEFYLRYLVNRIRSDCGFHHIPLTVELREQS